MTNRKRGNLFLQNKNLWQLTDRQLADTTIHRQCFLTDSRLTDTTTDRHDKSQTLAYWPLLKQAANKNMEHSISSKQFAVYFKAINDLGDSFFFFFQIDEDIMFFNERYVRREFQIMFDELNSENTKDWITNCY